MSVDVFIVNIILCWEVYKINPILKILYIKHPAVTAGYYYIILSYLLIALHLLSIYCERLNMTFRPPKKPALTLDASLVQVRNYYFCNVCWLGSLRYFKLIFSIVMLIIYCFFEWRRCMYDYKINLLTFFLGWSTSWSRAKSFYWINPFCI